MTNREIFGTNDKKVMNTQRYEKVSYNSAKYSQRGLHQSKSSAVLKKNNSPTKNFKVINQRKETPVSSRIASLKTEKLNLGKYNTNKNNEKGHHRVETWAGNQLLNRKSSAAVSQSNQNSEASSAAKLSKGYQAYLTTKRAANHSRKSTAIPSASEKVSKFLTSSKSSSKLPETSYKTTKPSHAFKSGRQSVNVIGADTKATSKPFSKYQKEIETSLPKPGTTPKNNKSQVNLKNSGAMTARLPEEKEVIETQPVRYERKYARKEVGKSSSGGRVTRGVRNKLRTKSRGEYLPSKDHSGSSSKNSNKCPSTLSKSNSRKKEGIASTKHMKKKSAAIPTRTTSTLYSNKMEYEKKRNLKATGYNMKASGSSSNIETRTSGRFVYNKSKPDIKYPTFDSSTSYKDKRDHYKVIKSSRDNRRLIEFKLRDDSQEPSNPEEVKFKNPSKFYKPKFSESKSGVGQKLTGTKSESKLDSLKNKYGKSVIAQSYKPKNPSISLDKSLKASKSGKIVN